MVTEVTSSSSALLLFSLDDRWEQSEEFKGPAIFLNDVSAGAEYWDVMFPGWEMVISLHSADTRRSPVWCFKWFSSLSQQKTQIIHSDSTHLVLWTWNSYLILWSFQRWKMYFPFGLYIRIDGHISVPLTQYLFTWSYPMQNNILYSFSSYCIYN